MSGSEARRPGGQASGREVVADFEKWERAYIYFRLRTASRETPSPIVPVDEVIQALWERVRALEERNRELQFKLLAERE